MELRHELLGKLGGITNGIQKGKIVNLFFWSKVSGKSIGKRGVYRRVWFLKKKSEGKRTDEITSGKQYWL